MSTGIASLELELSPADAEIRILPTGVFRAADGRPENLPGWKIDAKIAQTLIAQAAASPDQLLIDYEHQSMAASKNGQPVPAAGWFRQMRWHEGKGLFMANAEWTAKAKGMIAAKEYRYISPVFAFDVKTGEVLRIVSVALTNTPALSGLVDLDALAINSYAAMIAGPRDSERAVQAFNAIFGEHGVFHPDTKRH